MTKVLGNRDVSLSEALHKLQDLPLHDLNVSVLRCSLKSRIVSDDMGEICESMAVLYANRREFEQKFPDAIEMNFIQFVSTYQFEKG